MVSKTAPLRWGVMGTGWIAAAFAEGLRTVEGARLVAVGSRTKETADRFADRWDVPRRHGDYQGLAEDGEVDVVYVATPHPLHHANTIMSLTAGKHVLCEKPLAMNAHEAEEMVAAARAHGRFLMEAMWTRCFPAMREVDRLLAEGAIGEPRHLTAEFGTVVPYDPTHRLFAPELGGGALLDLGIYPVALASRYLGGLTVDSATARLTPEGVDAHTAVTVTGANAETGLLGCSSHVALPNRAVLAGTGGWIEVERFWSPTTYHLHRPDHEPQTRTFANRANGYEHEAEEVTARISDGRVESPLMPWEESLRIARTLDEVLHRVGVVYPDGASTERTHRRP